MNHKIIPLSKSEAWRLYSQGNTIVEMKSFKSKMIILNKGHTFSKFNDSQMIFALYLSKEESEKIHVAGNWRALKTIVSIYSMLIGLSFFHLWLSGSAQSRFSSTENFVFSQILFLLGSYLIISVFNSRDQEIKAWAEIFEKYSIPQNFYKK